MANDDSGNPGPLSDLRLIEMGTLLAGPFCGQLMGDFGAEVIKVEPPGKGDPMREWGQEKAHGMSLWWPVIARNKKSVTLNLKTEQGKDIFRTLAKTADVVVENFRPGVMKRLGFSYEVLREINPKLIYCAISGFGQTGPDAMNPAYDQIIQGLSGVMAINGDERLNPLRCGFPVCDTVGGLNAAFAIMGALY